MIKTFKNKSIKERDKIVNNFLSNPYIKVLATQTNIMNKTIITTIFYENIGLLQKLRK